MNTVATTGGSARFTEVPVTFALPRRVAGGYFRSASCGTIANCSTSSSGVS